MHDFSPALFVALAVCGGGTPDTNSPYGDSVGTSSSGWTCWELQRMIDVDIQVGQACRADRDCEQVIPDEDTCETNNPVLNIRHPNEFLFALLDKADAIDCDTSFISGADCPASAGPVWEFRSCSWRQ